MPSLFVALHHRKFRSIFFAEQASVLGDAMSLAAIPMAVYQISGSIFDAGLATLCRMLPWVLWGPVAGVLTDMWDRKKTMILCDSIRCLLILSLVLAQSVLWYYFVLLVHGLFSATQRPARSALIPELLPVSDLPAGAALHRIGVQLGFFTGPALTGVMLDLWGFKPVFMIDAGTFAISALIVSLQDLPYSVCRHRVKIVQFVRDFRDGFNVLWSDKLLRESTLTYLVGFAGLASIPPLAVTFASQAPARSGTFYGLLLSSFPLGSIIGAMTGSVIPRSHYRAVISIASLLVPLAILAGAFVAEMTNLMVFWLLGGVGLGIQAVLVNVLLAQKVSLEFRGRVYGLVNSGIYLQLAMWPFLTGAALSIARPEETMLGLSLTLGLALVGTFLIPIDRLTWPTAVPPIPQFKGKFGVSDPTKTSRR